MANVIFAGTNGFDALLYPEQNRSNVQYIENQFQNLGQNLSEFGRQFVEGAKQIYETIHSSEAMALARLAIRNAKGTFGANVITPLNTLEDFQTATPTMQRWIMAEPNVRSLFHQQRCDGFADSFVDLYPDVTGDKHYDYRRVMDGVIQETEDSWVATFYPDDLVDGDRELNHHEKCVILKTWDVMAILLDAKNDPTNPYGGKL